MNSSNARKSSYSLAPVSFENVRVEDSFWQPRLNVHRKTTLQACLEKCHSTGRISNFKKAAGLIDGEFEGIYFNDSDVHKVIEGIAYSLINNPDPNLEKTCDGIIDIIASAQEENGYPVTYFTLSTTEKSGQTWKNTRIIVLDNREPGRMKVWIHEFIDQK